MEKTLSCATVFRGLNNFIEVEIVSWLKNQSENLVSCSPIQQHNCLTVLIIASSKWYKWNLILDLYIYIKSFMMSIWKYLSVKLTDYQNTEQVRICKDALKLLRDVETTLFIKYQVMKCADRFFTSQNFKKVKCH